SEVVRIVKKTRGGDMRRRPSFVPGRLIRAREDSGVGRDDRTDRLDANDRRFCHKRPERADLIVEIPKDQPERNAEGNEARIGKRVMETANSDRVQQHMTSVCGERSKGYVRIHKDSLIKRKVKDGI